MASDFVAQQLQDAGAFVTVCDPHATANAKLRYPLLAYTDVLLDAVTDADGVLLLTEWQEYRELDPAALRQLVHRPIMVDGRNVLDPRPWRTAGWSFGALGRP